MAISIDARGNNRAYYIAMQTLQERQRMKAEGLQVTPRPTRIKVERPTVDISGAKNALPSSEDQAVTVFKANEGSSLEAIS